MTRQMLAISQRQFGGPDVLTAVTADRPQPGPNEILVRVHATAVNTVDWLTRAGGGLGTLGEPPFILGWDVSGTVESVGLGVTLFAPGDEVVGMPRFPYQAGAYAQYAAGPARHFVHKPDRLGHVEAAALPLAGLTAWQALVDTAHLAAGQRVLVHGAGGDVGHLAVQIARARGARVAGTARRTHHPALGALGVQEVVDPTETDFGEALRDVDVVLDTVGGDCAARSLSVLRPGGLLVTVPAPPSAALADRAARLGVRTAFVLVEPDRSGLSELMGLVRGRLLHPVVDTVLPLTRATRAHELGESGRAFGKVVLTAGAHG
ncbi:NADP-dependent oxidoreductase [Streptomyces sp. SP17BM10]|uniref:NADP-dependent oxidoreductase n=1 Tax=Streptomyces sp. SP17BM10 TaxID=3002530 RepID=UPI002E75E49D|nr:NADP-dependent oxidoreductase [Streptomyces sp. SP17BM10]MEE1784156.1 NADP-dependent oxidoreductase [Streptomyces sp. SP17BM10]